MLQRRGKRRWLFGKPALNTKEQNQGTKATNIKCHGTENGGVGPPKLVGEEEKRNAIEVAIATAAAAEAAVATAQAAVEFIRMTRPCILVKENQAVVVIQKAFRGYLVGYLGPSNSPLLTLCSSVVYLYVVIELLRLHAKAEIII